MLFFHLSTWKKVALVCVALVALPTILALVPQQYIERVQTIQTYEQDGSANARFMAWNAAWAVVKARPWTGAGFQIIDDVPAVQEFYPEFNRTGVGVHSVYFEVMAENGFVAFFVFVLLLLSAILGADSMRRRFKHTDPKHPFYHYGSMLTIGLLSYATTGLFLEFASFNLFYHFVAILVIMKRLAPAELEAANRAPVGSTKIPAVPAAAGAYLGRPARPSPYAGY
jgi:probable O-glycosylation ligase (exosortase A-associated)